MKLLITATPRTITHCIVALVAATLALAGCGDSGTPGPSGGVGDPCSESSPCEDGLSCEESVCAETGGGDVGDEDADDATSEDDATADATGPEVDVPSVPDVDSPDSTTVEETDEGDAPLMADGDEPDDTKVGSDGDVPSLLEDADVGIEGCTDDEQCAGAFEEADVTQCQAPRCNLETGQCEIGVADDGVPCDDGSECTYNDACSAGSCEGIGGECDDGNPCTEDTCTATGCQFDNVVGDCDDGTNCTTSDFCINGQCLGDAVLCNAPPINECASESVVRTYTGAGSCNANTGDCDYEFVDTVCPEGCLAGACVSEACEVLGAGSPCDDGFICTTDDVCAANNTCEGVPVDCSGSDNDCNDAACDPGTGECAQTAVTDGALCEDGDICSVNDTCLAGVCTGGNDKDCSDGNPCTNDSCDPATGDCAWAANTFACEDGSACTINDTCADGFCFGEDQDCSDGDPCTEDLCDDLTGCNNPVTGGPCDDGDDCTEVDTCAGGTCAGQPKTCDDGNPCTTKECQEGGECVVVGNSDATFPCYGGDEGTEGIGACEPGVRTCTGNTLGPCIGQVLPVAEICDNDTDDNCNGPVDEQPCTAAPVGLAKAPLEFTLDPDGPGLLVGTPLDQGNGNYLQSVGVLNNAPPATSGATTVTLGPLSDTASFFTNPRVAGSVTGFVRTPLVHADNPEIRGVAVVLDVDGRPRIAPGTTVTMRLQKTGKSDVNATCSLSSQSVCDISAEVPQDWFTTGIPGVVSVTFSLPTGQPTPFSTVTLGATPAVDDAPDPGVTMQLPFGPRYATTTFTVPIMAHSTDSNVESFDLAIAFDNSVLTVVGSEINEDLYDGVTNPGIGSVQMVGVRKSGAEAADTQGTVHLADVTLRVNANATGEGDISAIIESMFDIQNVPLVAGGTDVVMQDQSGSTTDGSVAVMDDSIIGVYAVADSGELFNTSRLDGNEVSTDLTVRTVRGLGPDADVTPDASCTSPQTFIVAVDDCTASVGTEQTASSDGLAIDVEYQGHTATVPMRVWQPVFPVEIDLDDAFLEKIEGWFEDDCTTSRYQSTAIRATAQFTPNGVTFTSGRVEHLLSFQADTAGLLTFEGTTATGVGEGTVNIQAVGTEGPIGDQLVVVTGSLVFIEELEVIVPTRVSLDGYTPQSPFELGATVSGSASVFQEFDFEGKTGPVIVHARMSDQTRLEVTEDMGLAATATQAGVIDITTEPLQVSALASGSGDLIDVRWNHCGEEVSAGVGHIELNLPAPESADVSLTSGVLSISGEDPAALAGVSICSGIDVSLVFETGQTKDYTLDSKTIYSKEDLTTGANLDPFGVLDIIEAFDSEGNRTSVQICSTGLATGPFLIQVGFTDNDIIVNVPIVIVKADGFTIDAHPWPTYPGSANVSKTTFSPYENTGIYQGGILDIDLNLDNGDAINITNHAALDLSAEPASSIIALDGTLIVPQAPGTADITADFGTATSDPFTVSVASSGVLAAAVTTSFPSTFHGVAGQETEQLDVTVDFGDGTTLLHAQSVAGLLTYTSSFEDAVTVSSGGVAALHENHREIITLTAQTVTTGLQGASQTSANLDPALGDIDLGEQFGLPHPDRAPGEIFVMPVRVNTGSKALGAIDVSVDYDPAVIFAMTAEAGGNWPGGQLEITLNDPPGTIQIVGAASVGTSAKGGALEVAEITFQALKAEDTNTTLIRGEIRKVLENTPSLPPIGPTIPVGESVALVAGHGLLDPDCDDGTKTEDILGNADGDCEFSVADVGWGLFYLADLIEGAVPSAQLQALDADSNGDVNVADVVYLVRVLAGKFRFADLALTEANGLTGNTTLEVSLVDKNGDPVDDQTTVYLEIETTQNLDMTIATGTSIGTSPAGLVIETEPVGGGIYRFSANTFAAEEDVGVTIILETENALGETAVDRQVALYGSPWLNDAPFTPYATVTLGSGEAPACLSDAGCDDGNACTLDECEPSSGCVYSNLDGEYCDDSNDCTEVDICAGGECIGDFPIPGCCPPGEVCEPVCFDGVCEDGEDCNNCEYDCGPCPPGCGNGTCEADESCLSCASDCGECEGDCCAPGVTAGCEDTEVSTCVCDLDPFCCNGIWDASCVAIADGACDGCIPETGCGNLTCEDNESCLTCATDCGACTCGDGECTLGAGEDCDNCEADCGVCPTFCGDGACDPDEGCESCSDDCGFCPPVCGDTFCTLVPLGDFDPETCFDCPEDCGECPPYCGDGSCDLDEGCLTCEADCGECGGDCCTPNGTPGCVDPIITACVCGAAEYCCNVAWDDSCANLGIAECGGDAICEFCGDGLCDETSEDCQSCQIDCGVCGAICGDGVCDTATTELSDPETCSECPQDCGECSTADCCEVQPADGPPGCGDPVVQNCVCNEQGLSFCCSGVWNDVCVGVALSSCAAPCDAVCGDGVCAGDDENCTTCEADCGECVGFCGDDECNGPEGEDCASCQADCGDCACDNNGLCENLENCAVCEFDCGVCSPTCQNDVCDPGENAQNCPYDCGAATCGDGNCAEGVENNENCPEDCDTLYCGDGLCSDQAEDCDNCPADCGGCELAVCGDGVCAGSVGGENCDTCAADCSGCADVCTAAFQVCGPSCDPIASTCAENTACVPTEDSADPGFDESRATSIETIGNGFCGTGCEQDAECGGGELCLPVFESLSPGVCLTACDPVAETGCGAGELCAPNPVSPLVGGCVPSGKECDPSSNTASGCGANNAYLQCVPLTGGSSTQGVCLEHCFFTDVLACDGIADNALECLPRNSDKYTQGTCVGTPLAFQCGPMLIDPCPPTDRCDILGGGSIVGYSFYCNDPGAGGEGATCAIDPDCQAGHFCYEDNKCRQVCVDAPCPGGTTCEDVSSYWNFDEPGVMFLCLP